ncbi:MAG: autotransporter outer membrane beta-barrel domain-containing protein [Rhizobiaceae bacterium]
MISKKTARRLGFAALAGTVSTLVISGQANACTSDFDSTTITITCEATDPPSLPFESIYPTILNMLGGAIRLDAATTPDPFLLPESFDVHLSDFQDFVDFQSGQIGAAEASVNVYLGAGDDLYNMSGGTLYGSLYGEEGYDVVRMSGGTITGDISAESVNLSGGTIGGDITGISATTLVIDDSASAPALDLRDGVLFSGFNANGTIQNTDLAAGGESQNFTGFNQLSVFASTLRFTDATVGITTLTLGGGSTLFVNGSTNMAGSVTAFNAAINMIDGAADDVFTLGGLSLELATIGVDIDQQTGRADQIVTNAFAANGTNTILVNLLGTPNFTQATDIPVIVATNDPVAGNFVIAGIPGTVGSLFTFEAVRGPAGGVSIRTTPTNVGAVMVPPAAVNQSATDLALGTVAGVTADAMDADLGLGNGSAQRAQLSPTFGVFASGQFAAVEHDGFSISQGNTVNAGPGFDASDFSAAVSVDFNAAKHFEFDEQYGLNIGAFAGYTSTDVDLDPFLGFDTLGNGENKAGMFGAYGLFRQGLNYALVSGTGFFGNTDVFNGALNTIGNYDTSGYAVTASAGHIFALSDRVRFDLRGGILGVSFTGDAFTDSGGNQFGKTRVSFGAVKFEPGVYADYVMESGMVFSPYLRGELQQRFAYRNTAEIGGQEFDFDDADFSAAVSTGFNLKMSDKTTLSGEVRGKTSSDSQTIAAKIGLKIAF